MRVTTPGVPALRHTRSLVRFNIDRIPLTSVAYLFGKLRPKLIHKVTLQGRFN
jgi:hypothetical protein